MKRTWIELIAASILITALEVGLICLFFIAINRLFNEPNSKENIIAFGIIYILSNNFWEFHKIWKESGQL